ncbi:hypothetical protein AKJ09_08325 [Labilithrix luteola]|uniref:Uncharacterized protein n=1 Tax=Labilithrix luteola TaxID=1391654 RepID=A0A0K1Q7L9_9BACT|nr:hypothetical protein [Labilithrix luteola]AKV01662.1 hypothetical protein AKJ09_08325 [Labilithrix luteola]
MANSNTNLTRDPLGGAGPFNFDLPVAGSTHVFEGTLISQLTANGAIAPYSTASSGVVVGVSQHEADNSSGGAGDKRCRVESRRLYAFANGAGGDAFSEASLIGSVVYGSDDHTVADNSASGTRKAVGFFYGMESDGKVRVFVDPAMAAIVNALQVLTDSPASADALRDNITAAFG